MVWRSITTWISGSRARRERGGDESPGEAIVDVGAISSQEVNFNIFAVESY